MQTIASEIRSKQKISYTIFLFWNMKHNNFDLKENIPRNSQYSDVASEVVLFCIACQFGSIEPTDIRLAGKPFESDAWRHLVYASPNLNELRVMHACVMGADVIVDKGELTISFIVMQMNCD